eukprot:363625-Chlamydomonas_euryale.AAC.4
MENRQFVVELRQANNLDGKRDDNGVLDRKATTVGTPPCPLAAFCMIFAAFLPSAIALVPHGLWDGCEWHCRDGLHGKWDAHAALMLAPACGCGLPPMRVLCRPLLCFLPSLVSPACMRFTQACPSRTKRRVEFPTAMLTCQLIGLGWFDMARGRAEWRSAAGLPELAHSAHAHPSSVPCSLLPFHKILRFLHVVVIKVEHSQADPAGLPHLVDRATRLFL